MKGTLKKGDIVYVLWGSDHLDRLENLPAQRRAAMSPVELKREAEKSPGKRGKVLSVLREKGRVVVEGINMQTKHASARGMPGRAARLQTGRIQQPGAIPIGKVMLVCPRCDRPTKVVPREVEGKKRRACRRCGEVIDQL
jgi:large subunit ribosomal protein L24